MILYHANKPLLDFRFSTETEDVFIIDRNYPENQAYLPLPLINNLTPVTLGKWLRSRTIPANRAYVQNFLAKLGINQRDTHSILKMSRGLSLNDLYWLDDTIPPPKFEEINLYQNRFSTQLAYMAFTGYGSYIRTSVQSSPEFTTNGMLAKCWRWNANTVTLYKSGTEGAANTGNEPYSEYYAYQIARAMGLDTIPYGLSRWKKRLCSTCPLFTSLQTAFLPAASLVQSKTATELIVEARTRWGDTITDAWIDIFLFDAIICNEDRHLGNFGFLIDNATNEIVSAAPIFDNGFSLFHYAMNDDIDHLEAYAMALRPVLYDDFVTFIIPHLTPARKKRLHALLEFRFERHPTYNLPSKRLHAIETFIHTRVAYLLG